MDHIRHDPNLRVGVHPGVTGSVRTGDLRFLSRVHGVAPVNPIFFYPWLTTPACIGTRIPW